MKTIIETGITKYFCFLIFELKTLRKIALARKRVLMMRHTITNAALNMGVIRPAVCRYDNTTTVNEQMKIPARRTTIMTLIILRRKLLYFLVFLSVIRVIHSSIGSIIDVSTISKMASIIASNILPPKI